MFPAFLAAICFSITAVCGSRAARLIGGVESNFWRLVVAAVCLGIWAHGFGAGLSGDAFPVFMLSGAVGIGIGDMALYQAYPRLGVRLTTLLLQCFTTAFAAIIEWLWLGTRLTPAEMTCGSVVMLGVVLALSPGRSSGSPEVGPRLSGVIFSTVAAFGNALGMVLSRKAYLVAGQAGQGIDGGTAAYQRLLGGLLLAGFVLLGARHRHVAGHIADPNLSFNAVRQKWGRVWLWVAANGSIGMALGVSCVQWALKATPTAVTQSVIAITPLTVIPLAWYIEGERPSRRSLVGGLIGVAGTIALTYVHHRT